MVCHKTHLDFDYICDKRNKQYYKNVYRECTTPLAMGTVSQQKTLDNNATALTGKKEDDEKDAQTIKCDYYGAHF